MTSYPNSGRRPQDFAGDTDDPGRYTPTGELTPDEGLLPASTEEFGGGYQPAGDRGPVTGLAGVYGSEGTGSTTDTTKSEAARSEAADIKDTAFDAGSEVAATARTEATTVAREVGDQARGLLDQLRSDMRVQGNDQKDRFASTLHSWSQELGSMASKSEQDGPVTGLAHQASRKGGEIAHWLENHDGGDVLHEIKRYARRRPVTFLALCAAAGVIAGRLTRGAVATNTSLDSPGLSSTDRSLRSSDGGSAAYAASTGPYGASGGASPGSSDPYAPGTTAPAVPVTTGPAGYVDQPVPGYTESSEPGAPVSTGMLNGPGDAYSAEGARSDDPWRAEGEYRP